MTQYKELMTGTRVSLGWILILDSVTKKEKIGYLKDMKSKRTRVQDTEVTKFHNRLELTSLLGVTKSHFPYLASTKMSPSKMIGNYHHESYDRVHPGYLYAWQTRKTCGVLSEQRVE